MRNFYFVPMNQRMDADNLHNMLQNLLNPLTPNDPCSGRTAPLTSKVAFYTFIPTNIGTEYFKHGIYSPFFLFKMQFVS